MWELENFYNQRIERKKQMDLQLYPIEMLAEELLRRSEFGEVCIMVHDKDDEPYYYTNVKGKKQQIEDSLCEVEECLEAFGLTDGS